MSERSPSGSGSSNETHQNNSSGDDHNDTLDDAASAANNSIIGKVKSRVSSILPNSLSKWFSPSTKTNDSLNGSLLLNATSGNARRRRRIEVDDDDDEEEDIVGAVDGGEYDENSLRRNAATGQDDNSDDDDGGEEDEEESNNSEEDTSAATTATTTTHQSGGLQPRRALNASERVRQPPSKRSRFNLDHTNTRDSSMLPRQPLVASTPAIGGNLRGFAGSMSNPPSVLVPTRGSAQRYSHLNLYGGQQQTGKSEPAYNLLTTSNREAQKPRYNLDFTQEQQTSEPNTSLVDSTFNKSGMSSRRSLNIPSSTIQNTNELMYTGGLSHLKRQTLGSVRSDLPSTSSGISSALKRTSTTILEIEDDDDEDERVNDVIIEETSAQVHAAVVDDEAEATKYNGRSATGLYLPYKREKLINGASGENIKTQKNNNSIVCVDDSESESSEGGGGRNEPNVAGRKTGLFNMSGANSRNGSRTSSVGNGLNFYSHLEGRKSLFAGGQSSAGAGNAASSAALNNSTLSLTSLNRRQFNASIYGSTSALSDSRLLNTFSPFYKGKTTYGGAAAYNKYAAAATGAGASAVRLTPTLIRPTSSLSTLSSSNNSLATAGGAAGGIAGGENSSAISSTAKRILDLINDFATPLSEAKKMANNLKTQQQQQSKTSSRLNESDLLATRALRLSQVRTPYMRPSVTLQPTHSNGKSTALPPTRELQVPSMSQLLQMKKMQTTTERSRQITTQNTFATTNTQHGAGEYTLPNNAAAQPSNCSGDWEQTQQTNTTQFQQKYTNKIKNKVRCSGRIAGSKDDEDDPYAPPSPVNLPNIAFPLMKSVPIFDIKLPIITSPAAKTDFKFATASKSSGAVNTNSFAFSASNTKNVSPAAAPKLLNSLNVATPPKAVTAAATLKSDVTINFKFSAPLELKALNTPTQQITPMNSSQFKFSPPTLLPYTAVAAANAVSVSPLTTTHKFKPLQTFIPLQAFIPPLKTGSVLEALKRQKSLATDDSAATAAVAPTFSTSAASASTTSFGSQFKKSASEWDCDACMLRNKQDAAKCVACETPRKSESAVVTSIQTISSTNNSFSTGSASNTFGSQFKKSSSEWECDSCMLRNKQDAVKCIACETSRKGVAPVGSAAAAITLTLPAIKNSFGDAFKPKSNTWECDTCLVNNKADSVECVACQTRKPGAPAAVPATTASTFNFGFSNAATTTTNAVDAGFKTLAAEQKAAKWECEACMTRNDAARVKCVCCEQAKPGTQTVSESVPKFAFGTSAAAKFSFGFGGAANAPKETELRQTAAAALTTQKTDAVASTGITFGVSAPAAVSATDGAKSATAAATSGGFTFGIKPIAAEASKDVAADNNTKSKESRISGFKFGGTPTVAAATPVAGTGIVFGAAKSAESANAASSSNTNSTSVKFSLPTSIKPTTTTTETAAGTEILKTATPAPAAGSFSFGSTAPAAVATKPVFAASPLQSNKNDTNIAGGFAFKTPAVGTSTTTAAVANSTNTITFGKTEATAANKPMFSFGLSAPTTSATATTTTSVTNPTAAGGFSFGSISNGADTSATPAIKSLFAASTVQTAAPPAFNSTSTPAATSSNMFGTSTDTATSSTALPVFGSAAKVAATSSATAAPSSTPTFGSFGGAASNTNAFGSFGGKSDVAAIKPTATATPFGNTGINVSATSAATTGTHFVFGSPSSSLSAASAASTNTNSSAAAASTTWPKNSFVFGGATAAASTTAASESASNDAATTVKTSNVFGSFGSTQSTAVAAPSLFGVPLASAPSAVTQQSVFGSSASVAGTTATFGANAMLSAGASSTNLFGSAAPTGNATTPAPAFGTSPFGGGGSSASATPTFGSAAAAPTTFGGFGSGANTAAATSSVTDGASAAKKSEPPVFSFGAAPGATQATSGGFNFSASTAKPAFNFAPTNQPAFNFTGTSETQTTTMTTTATPFQFGATCAAPVFNFSGGAVETTPNAPFQFNAGATPASNNIFAPQPIPGATQSAQQQARRKIRAPIRRQTPR